MTAGLAHRHDIEPGHHSSQRRMLFGGDAVALPEDLAACANGGQVVLSEAAWSAVQEQLPGACQVTPFLWKLTAAATGKQEDARHASLQCAGLPWTAHAMAVPALCLSAQSCYRDTLTAPVHARPTCALPRQCRECLQSISLGVHCVSDAFPEAMLLMEVLPAPLASRDFPRLATARMLEAGYRDSPHPSSLAIVFVIVSHWPPLSCLTAQRSPTLRPIALAMGLCGPHSGLEQSVEPHAILPFAYVMVSSL